MSWLSAMFAFLSGALITCQAGANTELKKSLGHPVPAVVINYSLGLLGVLIYSVMTKVSVPPLSSISTVPWWGWIGSLLGVAYGLAAVFLGSKLGPLRSWPSFLRGSYFAPWSSTTLVGLALKYTAPASAAFSAACL